MKKKQFKVGIIGVTLIFLLALIGCPGGGGGGGSGDEGDLTGTNEVKGKTFYFDSYTKTVFAASTFEAFEWSTRDKDSDTYTWETSAKGSYKYNAKAKTVTATVSHIMMYNAQGKPTLMNKTQAQNAVTAEIDEMIKELKKEPLWMAALSMGLLDLEDYGFEFDYDDDYYGNPKWDDMDYWEAYDVAAAEWLQVNGTRVKAACEADLKTLKITNHDQLLNYFIAMEFGDMGIKTVADYKKYARDQIGEAFNPQTFSYEFTEDGSMLGRQVLPANKGTDELKGKTYTEYYEDADVVFAASGNTYTFDSDYSEHAGTYAYDSTKKTVWLRPETRNGKTMAEYCEDVHADNDDGKFASDDEYKAAETNEAFSVERYLYDTDELELYRDYGGGMGKPKPDGGNEESKPDDGMVGPSPGSRVGHNAPAFSVKPLFNLSK